MADRDLQSTVLPNIQEFSYFTAYRKLPKNNKLPQLQDRTTESSNQLQRLHIRQESFAFNPEEADDSSNYGYYGSRLISPAFSRQSSLCSDSTASKHATANVTSGRSQAGPKHERMQDRRLMETISIASVEILIMKYGPEYGVEFDPEDRLNGPNQRNAPGLVHNKIAIGTKAIELFLAREKGCPVPTLYRKGDTSEDLCRALQVYGLCDPEEIKARKESKARKQAGDQSKLKRMLKGIRRNGSE